MSRQYSSTLIKTKLLAPVSSPGMLVREKLIGLLRSALNRKLILVSAPAGFGKTTLIGQWFEIMQKQAAVLGWLSLNDSDNEPTGFLRYIIAALQESDNNIGCAAMRQIDSAPATDISSFLGSLVNDLINVDGDIFLFLDDFHAIREHEIKQFVELLINLSPANFHLIISARTLPDLPLASMRVRNDLLHLSADRLRFDLEESERFLCDSRGLRLEKKLLRTLHERCEGWSAGLQLASLSLKEADDQETFIHRFSGNIKDVTDYLAATVLNQQPESVRNFLLGTAVLDRLNADLCDTLLDSNDAHELLQILESENLFIVPLDQERKWYRYHALFREFLLVQAGQEDKEQLNILIEKASSWFRQRGLLNEAVDYALRAGNMQTAVELIENRAIAEFTKGRMPRVAAWINKIPSEIQRRHPRLLLLQGTALYHMNQAEQAFHICELLEKSLNESNRQNDLGANGGDELRNELLILRAGIDMSLDNASAVIRDSPEELHSQQNFMEGVINNIKGYSYFALGEFDNARRHMSLARQAHQRVDSDFGVVCADCFLSMLEFSKGDMCRARQVFQRTKPGWNASDQPHYMSAAQEVMLAAIDYETNAQERCINTLQNNLKSLEKVGHISLIQLGYITLAKEFAAEGNFELGLQVLDSLSNLYPNYQVNRHHQLLVGYNRIKLLLRCGKRAEAVRMTTSLDVPLGKALVESSEWSREDFQKQLIQARLWLIGGQQEELLSSVKRLYELAHKMGMEYRAVECQLLLAQAYLKLARHEDAMASIHRALIQAATNNIVRICVDEGSEILTLVKEAQSTAREYDAVLRSFISDVLLALEADVSPRVGPYSTKRHATLLIDPLSQRELDVLELMATGKSNANIAEKLHISENTVKWHARNLFGKLRAKNRTEAVVLAQDLDLLGPC